MAEPKRKGTRRKDRHDKCRGEHQCTDRGEHEDAALGLGDARLQHVCGLGCDPVLDHLHLVEPLGRGREPCGPLDAPAVARGGNLGKTIAPGRNLIGRGTRNGRIIPPEMFGRPVDAKLFQRQLLAGEPRDVAQEERLIDRAGGGLVEECDTEGPLETAMFLGFDQIDVRTQQRGDLDRRAELDRSVDERDEALDACGVEIRGVAGCDILFDLGPEGCDLRELGSKLRQRRREGGNADGDAAFVEESRELRRHGIDLVALGGERLELAGHPSGADVSHAEAALDLHLVDHRTGAVRKRHDAAERAHVRKAALALEDHHSQKHHRGHERVSAMAMRVFRFMTDVKFRSAGPARGREGS